MKYKKEFSAFIQFLMSKTFLINLGIAIVLIVAVIWITLESLESYTLHGQQINVPNLRGKVIEEIKPMLKEKKLNIKITDSTYVKNQPPLAVIEQNPRPNAKVKKNRTIYLTVNATSPPKVKVPKLTDQSLRSALSELELSGLKPGSTIYKPHPWENYVLGQQINGKKVEPGASVTQGTKVDLVVGSGVGDKKVRVPDVTGLKLDEARFVLNGASLNVGLVEFETQDSLNAIVYKQVPTAASDRKLPMGYTVDLYLDIDSTSLPTN